MTEIEMLEKVKSAIGVGGTYQDVTIQIYIDEVKDYLSCAGISESIINSKKALGVIVRGVLDLWDYGNGGKLSEYFMHRVTQLSLCSIGNTDTEETESGVILLLSGGLKYMTSENQLFLAKGE